MSHISVIIPVLNEQEGINAVLTCLRLLETEAEIIVVDGDPNGSTLSALNDKQVIRLISSKGRGQQLATGVAAASGDVLLLLHADTLLPDNALLLIQQSILQDADWGAFRLGLDAPGFAYRIIERMVDLRCKLFTLPYGDQAMFVTRTALQKVGGMPEIPLMEDIELARRLNRAGFRFKLLPERVSTSARRWKQDGIISRTLNNWWLLLRYLCGTTPHKLMGRYR